MKADQASSTAKVIAAATILLASDPRDGRLVAPGAAEWCRRFLSQTPADRMLARSASNPIGRALWRGLERLTHPGIIAHYWHRKRWIERQCRSAIDAGYERVLVIGAGLDTLACRLSPEFGGVQFVEVDHPATQRLKRRALAGDAPVLIPVDLGRDALPVSVTESRTDTVVVIEGMLMYLAAVEVERLFDSLHAMSAERLRIVFSFMTKWPDRSSGFRPRSGLIERWLALRSEPFTWSMEPEAVPAFLAARGFRVEELALTRELSGGRSALDGENLVSCERAGPASRQYERP